MTAALPDTNSYMGIWTKKRFRFRKKDQIFKQNNVVPGATFGRLFGSLLLLAGLDVYVGTYSLIGAAALLGGVVRMTGIVQTAGFQEILLNY